MSKHLEILDFLKSHNLFAGFTAEQVNQILPYIERKKFQEGEWILKEEEEGKEICFFVSGKAESLTRDEEGKYHCLEVFETGDWSGAAAFLENKKQMASLRAVEPSEVLVICLTKLRPLLEKMGLYSQFISNLSGEVCHLLRDNYERLFHSMKEKAKLLKEHDLMGQIIVHLFILISVYFYLFNVFESYLKGIVSSAILTPFVIIGLAISCAIFIKSSGLSLKFYGLTAKNWLRDSAQAVIWSLPLMALTLLVKWVLIQHVDAFKEKPLFEIALADAWLYGGKETLGTVMLFTAYLLMVPVQEFLTRGFMQTVFRGFFRGSSRVILAILVSNLLFELFHTIKGVAFSSTVFALGLFWGTLYEQQRSIVGVSVSHALIALWGFGFLGFQKILSSS